MFKFKVKSKGKTTALTSINKTSTQSVIKKGSIVNYCNPYSNFNSNEHLEPNHKEQLVLHEEYELTENPMYYRQESSSTTYKGSFWYCPLKRISNGHFITANVGLDSFCIFEKL